MVMALIDDLKNRYRNGDVLTRLLFINIGVFVLLLLLDITFTLITVGRTGFAAELFQYPWNPAILLLRPWTPITALFTSYGLWNFLFNMLTLYWIGSLFQKFFTNTHLRGLYIIGGLTTMACYTGIMLIPAFRFKDWSQTMPMTAACILSIAVALAFRAPEHKEAIPLIGEVKIKYIVIILALIDIALLPKTNPATDLAYIGAAAAGFMFNRLLRKGVDITKPVTVFFVWIDNLINRWKKRRK